MRLLSLLTLSACGFAPNEGTWLYANEEVTSNTCGFDYSPTTGTFSLQDNGDGNLVIDAEDGSDPFLCTLDAKEKTYDCPGRFVETVDIGLGALVNVNASAEGEFDSPQSGDGSQTGTLDCANATCVAAAAIAGVPDPCSITVTYDIVWSEE